MCEQFNNANKFAINSALDHLQVIGKFQSQVDTSVELWVNHRHPWKIKSHCWINYSDTAKGMLMRKVWDLKKNTPANAAKVVLPLKQKTINSCVVKCILYSVGLNNDNYKMQTNQLACKRHPHSVWIWMIFVAVLGSLAEKGKFWKEVLYHCS